MSVASAEAKPQPRLRAFSVLEDNENTGGIVFARHSIVARRQGSSQFGDGDFEGWSCRRVPWADSYAETGNVPISVMIRHGWHFECTSCGVRVDEDLPDHVNKLGHRAYAFWRPEHVIGSQHGSVFCRRSCHSRWQSEENERRRRQLRWIARFEAIIRARFGDDVQFHQGQYAKHASVERTLDGRWRVRAVSVSFILPELVHGPALLRYDFGGWPYKKVGKPCYSCAYQDQGALHAALARTQKGSTPLP